jgi:hypothetical protein
MYDLEIIMENQPGQLALMGETLGKAGFSVEGGGMFLVDGVGIAHFLFEDGPGAQAALQAAGMTVKACREVLVQRLSQGEPGQLGKICRAMADAGVNIEILYSDHDHRLVLVADDPVKGHQISEKWTTQRVGTTVENQ